MDPNANTEENPAATVADAAMNGATPVVTTTDPTASDVAPEPTLQAPAPDAPVLDTSVLDASALGAPAPDATPALDPALATPAPEAPADDGPVSLAPSADFQMGEVSTVSAVQNGADGNLAAAADNEVMIGQPFEQPEATPEASAAPENPTDDPTVDQLANTEVGEPQENPNAANDFNNPEDVENAEAEAEKKTLKDEIKDDPIIAAAPVPGSIGSAKSYADIQRAEAEKAAKVAARQGKGGLNLSKNTIIIIAIAAVAVIGIIIGAIVLLGGNSATPTATSTQTSYDDPGNETHDLSTLSCKRNLALEEYASYGAISGMQENIFYFKDDTLDGLVTNFSYTYATKALANIWRDKLSTDYGVTPNSGVDEESAVKRNETDSEEEEDDEEETSGSKTTAEMLYHYVNTKDLTVIHGMMIKSEDIKAWLDSDAYSDVTYGATENGAAAPVGDDEEESEEETTEDGEVIRNLKYYNRLQNSIDYTCSISKGY